MPGSPHTPPSHQDIASRLLACTLQEQLRPSYRPPNNRPLDSYCNQCSHGIIGDRKKICMFLSRSAQPQYAQILFLLCGELIYSSAFLQM